MNNYACSAACNKGDYSWVYRVKNGKTSRLCEIAQSGVESVYCVYNNADSLTHNNTAVDLSLEH